MTSNLNQIYFKSKSNLFFPNIHCTQSEHKYFQSETCSNLTFNKKKKPPTTITNDIKLIYIHKIHRNEYKWDIHNKWNNNTI